ncbi:MAG: carboxypeptidase M32, partial [Anaerolineales bacterium]|nr:carboxypeptidase M32 [Anaerolineales bacterium]
SRLWENQVGRSLAFWQRYYSDLQEMFPSELAGVQLSDFHKAVNAVERSLIRTDADEVTYNLHVLVRFDLELQLLEGDLEVRHLPEAWRERYREDLGVAPEDDRDGVLQDVHWYAGSIGGMFQGYTLGNLMAAQIFAAAREQQPGIMDDIRRGEFQPLRGWLAEEIHRHGRKFTANELLPRVTGQDLTVQPYLAYLREKFGPLYDVEL